MDEHIQYGVTDGYFDTVPVGDGVAVRMSDNAARGLAHLVDRLIRFLETGETSEGRTGTAPDMTGIWLNHVQECLVLAVNPRLAH